MTNFFSVIISSFLTDCLPDEGRIVDQPKRCIENFKYAMKKLYCTSKMWDVNNYSQSYKKYDSYFCPWSRQTYILNDDVRKNLFRYWVAWPSISYWKTELFFLFSHLLFFTIMFTQSICAKRTWNEVSLSSPLFRISVISMHFARLSSCKSNF